MAGMRKSQVAVIGCGYWGKNLVRNFHALGTLAMVCDATPAGRATARELAPDVAITPCVEDSLRADGTNLVIATPAETHYGLVKQALEAGKDVFVEKPLALTYEQGAHLVRLAEAHERILMVGHVLEYHPAIVLLQDLGRSGALGKVQYIYSNRLSLGKIRREENILWSFAPHDVAVILRLMGSLPFQVAAFGGSYVQPNIADVTVTTLLFDNGVRVHIHVSWLHPFLVARPVEPLVGAVPVERPDFSCPSGCGGFSPMDDALGVRSGRLQLDGQQARADRSTDRMKRRRRCVAGSRASVSAVSACTR